MTPCEYERRAGRATAKNWKKTIHYSGTPISNFLQCSFRADGKKQLHFVTSSPPNSREPWIRSSRRKLTASPASPVDSSPGNPAIPTLSPVTSTASPDSPIFTPIHSHTSMTSSNSIALRDMLSPGTSTANPMLSTVTSPTSPVPPSFMPLGTSISSVRISTVVPKLSAVTSPANPDPQIVTPVDSYTSSAVTLVVGLPSTTTSSPVMSVQRPLPSIGTFQKKPNLSAGGSSQDVPTLSAVYASSPEHPVIPTLSTVTSTASPDPPGFTPIDRHISGISSNSITSRDILSPGTLTANPRSSTVTPPLNPDPPSFMPLCTSVSSVGTSAISATATVDLLSGISIVVPKLSVVTSPANPNPPMVTPVDSYTSSAVSSVVGLPSTTTSSPVMSVQRPLPSISAFQKKPNPSVATSSQDVPTLSAVYGSTSSSWSPISSVITPEARLTPSVLTSAAYCAPTVVVSTVIMRPTVTTSRKNHETIMIYPLLLP